MQEFTKEQAVEAMLKGEKMTHHLFSEGEWVTMHNGTIVTEDRISQPNFWEFRRDSVWLTGWIKFEEPKMPQPESKKTNFEILTELMKGGKDLRMSPHFVSAQKCAGGGLVTMGVDTETLIDLIRPTIIGKPKYMLQLFVIDIEKYNLIRDAK